MKKSKLSVGLVTSFIAALAMTSCTSNLTSSKDAILTLKDYDGNVIEVITDEVYKNYLSSANGISKFYDAVMEVLIRYEYQEGNLNGKTSKTYAQIKTEAENKIKGLKAEAKSNAEANDTKYEDEWKSILESNGVEKEDELLEKFIYELEKEEVEDWYFEDNKAALTQEYIGVNTSGAATAQNVTSKFPYHIRHILMNVSAGASNFYNGTVTEAEALKLSTVVTSLADGKSTFGHIANIFSDDTGSAEVYGDAGIMDTETSFVNEFKLGVYAYDAVYSRASANATINKGLGITDDVKAKLDAIGLSYVPYKAFTTIGAVRSDTESSEGNPVNGGNENYYPRNIYWNKYLNHHNVFVITNNDLDDAAVDGEGGAILTDAVYDTAAAGKCGFRYVEGVSTSLDHKVLTDEAGRVIIGVRSEYGIHLMIMQKSIYDFNVDGQGAEASLSEYYTTYTPDESEYPTHDGVAKKTYVNYLNTNDKSILNERANTVKSAIKSFDSTYSYRLYEHFVSNGNVEFAQTADGESLGDIIQDYINSQREYNNWNDAKTLSDTWRTYLELLEVQEANRTAQRLIPELCAIRFKNADTDPAFDKGGVCYYAQ